MSENKHAISIDTSGRIAPSWTALSAAKILADHRARRDVAIAAEQFNLPPDDGRSALYVRLWQSSGDGGEPRFEAYFSIAEKDDGWSAATMPAGDIVGWAAGVESAVKLVLEHAAIQDGFEKHFVQTHYQLRSWYATRPPEGVRDEWDD